MRFLHKNPELYGGAAGLSEPVKEKTGQTFFPSAWSSFSVEGDDLCAERAGYRMSGAGMGPEFREWRPAMKSQV